MADTCSVNALMRRAKTDQVIIWILLLDLELRQDERKLCKLGLSLIFDGLAHSFEYSWLMKLISI